MKKIKSVQNVQNQKAQQPKEFKEFKQTKPLDHEMKEMKNGQDIAPTVIEPKEQPKEHTEKIAVKVIEDTPKDDKTPFALRKLTPPTPQVGIIEPDALWKMRLTALVADEDRELVAVKAELKAQYLATVTERTNGIVNTYRARRDERIRALIEKEGSDFMANYQVAPDFSTIHVFPDDILTTNRV